MIIRFNRLSPAHRQQKKYPRELPEGIFYFDLLCFDYLFRDITDVTIDIFTTENYISFVIPFHGSFEPTPVIIRERPAVLYSYGLTVRFKTFFKHVIHPLYSTIWLLQLTPG